MRKYHQSWLDKRLPDKNYLGDLLSDEVRKMKGKWCLAPHMGGII